MRSVTFPWRRLIKRARRSTIWRVCARPTTRFESITASGANTLLRSIPKSSNSFVPLATFTERRRRPGSSPGLKAGRDGAPISARFERAHGLQDSLPSVVVAEVLEDGKISEDQAAGRKPCRQRRGRREGRSAVAVVRQDRLGCVDKPDQDQGAAAENAEGGPSASVARLSLPI